jgi:hypothetical protein
MDTEAPAVKKPRKQRLKAKGPRHRDKGKMSAEKRAAQSARSRALWQDPEYRAKQARHNATTTNRRHRTGVPDGYTRAEAVIAWEQARAKTEVIFKQMIESGAIEVVESSDIDLELVTDPATGVEHYIQVPRTDEGKAAIALKECVLAMLSPMNNQAEKHEEFLERIVADAKMINGDGK